MFGYAKWYVDMTACNIAVVDMIVVLPAYITTHAVVDLLVVTKRWIVNKEMSKPT